jgi:hypothetical protein
VLLAICACRRDVGPVVRFPELRSLEFTRVRHSSAVLSIHMSIRVFPVSCSACFSFAVGRLGTGGRLQASARVIVESAARPGVQRPGAGPDRGGTGLPDSETVGTLRCGGSTRTAAGAPAASRAPEGPERRHSGCMSFRTGRAGAPGTRSGVERPRVPHRHGAPECGRRRAGRGSGFLISGRGECRAGHRRHAGAGRGGRGAGRAAGGGMGWVQLAVVCVPGVRGAGGRVVRGVRVRVGGGRARKADPGIRPVADGRVPGGGWLRRIP